MKRLGLAAALLSGAALLSLSSSLPVGAQAQQALVIQGGTLIDGNGGAPIPNSVVVIQGNRITAAGPAGQVQVPAGAQTINAAGKWVTPGLIDAKANWNWPYGEAFLAYGVTSAVISGTRNDTGIADRDAINHGIFEGPRLYQGYLNLQGGGENGERPNNYVPGSGNRIVRTPEEAREIVRYNLSAGADFIGTADGNSPPEVWAAAADEAHKAGVGIVMRCVGPFTRGRECVLAGADMVIHTANFGNQMAADEAKWANYVGLPPEPYCDMDPAKEAAMVQFIVQHNTALEPDLIAADRGMASIWPRILQETKDFFSDPNLLAYYPEVMRKDVIDNQALPEEWLAPDKLATRKCGYQNHVKFLRDVVAAGGHIVAASDITQSPPGLGLHQEMDVFQADVGLTPMQVLQSASSWVAQHMRLNDVGTVEVGKFADLIIANADPLQDIRNLRNIDTVIKDGKIVDRSYDPAYRGWMFANDPQHAEFGPVVADAGWADALKRATWRPNVGHVRGEAGLPGTIPDLGSSPTPGIENIFPHTVLRKSPGFTLQITGFNFVKRSQVYVDDIPVPTEVVSRTEIRAQIDENILGMAGNKKITVRNPLPLIDPIWGDTSNRVHLLVPFEFTTKYSMNRDVGEFQE